jgi:enoyl-CoA hydratase/carnithine racemase
MSEVFLTDHVLSEVNGQVGCITLNRPGALNALSLPMIRAITQSLLTWRDDNQIKAVAFRGVSKDASSQTGSRPFGSFCAGGDIRFFHQAALSGNPELEDFFTEEYALNHLIHTFSKPTISFLDGIVMGGGMGLAQGTQMRIVTGHTKMAMPETHIGLFPDVGGGYFLSRCPGYVGEWLALTGMQIGGADAIRYGLADHFMDAGQLPAAWAALGQLNLADASLLNQWIATYSIANYADSTGTSGTFDSHFSLKSVLDIIASLQADSTDVAQEALQQLRKASPLMLQVTLTQIRRARTMTLADDLRMERDMVRRCFTLRPGVASETVEGIRALAVDKDRSPKWNPDRIEDVTLDMVEAFFRSPWPQQVHPLGHLT